MSAQRKTPKCYDVAEQQVDSAAALSVALQHPAVSSDPKIICSLLQTCKSWKAAVQQSTAGQSNICVDIGMELVQLPKLVEFSRWLPRHAGVVGSITMSKTPAEDSHDEWDAADVVAMLTLEKALQDAARAEVLSGSTGQWSKRWGLRSFSTDNTVTAGILAALPAASLTNLDVGIGESERLCMEAIGCLHNLQQLELWHCGNGFAIGSVQQLSQLTAVTQLRLHLINSGSDTRVLPQQLQQLKLTYSSAKESEQLLVDLHHLTRLTQLHIVSFVQPSAGSALPEGLQELTLECWGGCTSRYCALSAFNIAKLQHLQSLQLVRIEGSAEQLQQLAHHPTLRHLALESPKTTVGLESTTVWQHIPQLHTLKLDHLPSTAEKLARLVANITCVAQLTRLCLCAQFVGPQRELGDTSPVTYEYLGAMTGLKDLEVRIPYKQPTHAIQHLARLTGLTRLYLGNLASAYIDDTTAVLLAVKLTNLQRLSLGKGRSRTGPSTAWLPALGQLTRLQHLSIRSLGPEAARQGLSYLTGLSRLTYLGGFTAAGEEAIDGFRALVRGLQMV